MPDVCYIHSQEKKLQFSGFLHELIMKCDLIFRISQTLSFMSLLNAPINIQGDGGKSNGSTKMISAINWSRSMRRECGLESGAVQSDLNPIMVQWNKLKRANVLSSSRMYGPRFLLDTGSTCSRLGAKGGSYIFVNLMIRSNVVTDICRKLGNCT